MRNNNVRNITKSIGNTASAVTGTVATATELLADTTGLLSTSVAATPAVLKALLTTPFAAAKGYLMEAEGMSAAEAEAAAYKYIKQDVALTIQEAGEGAGKLAAALFEDDEPEANTANSVEESNQTQINATA